MIRLLALLTLWSHHASAQEIITYGPWQGYWQQARLSAYSPHDALDKAYHETKGERWRWITADGRTDVRSEPYGLAAPSSIRFGTRVFIPTGHGYLDRSRPTPDERLFVVSDRGERIERGSAAGQRICIDVRFRTEYSALAFGIKDALVFIITADAPAQREALK